MNLSLPPEVKEIIKDYVRIIDFIHGTFDGDRFRFRYKDNSLGYCEYIGFWTDGKIIDIANDSKKIGLYNGEYITNLAKNLLVVPVRINLTNNNLIYLDLCGIVRSYDLIKQTEKVIINTEYRDFIYFDHNYISVNNQTELKIYDSVGKLIDTVSYKNQKVSSYYSYTVDNDNIQRTNHLTGKNNKYLVPDRKFTDFLIFHKEYCFDRKGYFYHFRDDDTYIKIYLNIKYILKTLDNLVYYFTEDNSICVINILNYQWRIIYDRVYTEGNDIEIVYDIYIGNDIDL